MDIYDLKADIELNYSTHQMASKYKVRQSTILYWLNKFKLKTKHYKFKAGTSPSRSFVKTLDVRYNWKDIQSYYDMGNPYDSITIKFGCARNTIIKAARLKLFIPRTLSEARQIVVKNGRGMRNHSETTKQKLSEIRLKYLTEHPDKVPYLMNHSSNKSWPEQVFENALISSNITGWKYAFQNGIYEYDFAFIDKKIDVEIDGGTHLSEKVKKIDARRDIFSKSKGWIVLRFTAKEVKSNVIKCIDELKKYL